MVADIDSYAPIFRLFLVIRHQLVISHFQFQIEKHCKLTQFYKHLLCYSTYLRVVFQRSVLSLLEVSAFSQRFGIDESELSLLRWVNESGSAGDDNVRSFALPVIGQNTWEFGLSRMLLGYAMDSRNGPWNWYFTL